MDVPLALCDLFGVSCFATCRSCIELVSVSITSTSHLSETKDFPFRKGKESGKSERVIPLEPLNNARWVTSPARPRGKRRSHPDYSKFVSKLVAINAGVSLPLACRKSNSSLAPQRKLLPRGPEQILCGERGRMKSPVGGGGGGGGGGLFKFKRGGGVLSK